MLFCVIASGSFFFFKQKTAYEMRISDWSSDVCSSDLSADQIAAGVRRRVGVDEIRRRPAQPPRLRDGRDIARKPAVAYRKIGRASCRERVCQYVKISVVAVALKKKQKTNPHKNNNKSKRYQH